ncbi:MAG: Crp/Fnr family transcriptional regulator [Acidobacteria bacterium]|nr:Crp/Fnr family transcriptional regulator [Acidobacteriota bacterium]
MSFRNDPPSTLRDVFRGESMPLLRLDAQQTIYATGDDDDSMYFVESGRVKLFLSSESGRDCLLAIYTSGDIFGESCFAGADKRLESASALGPTTIRRLQRRDFIVEVGRAELTDALLRHLATRIAERQVTILDLVTSDSERRLAKTLFELAQKLGTPEGPYIRIDERVSQEELSQMVGTTRPRVTAFMQRFRTEGIIDTPDPRSIRIHRERMLAYLALPE